ncbi:MAG: hypothetical protein ACI9KE_005078, partial [Polyangiales bacterium]
CGAKIEVVCLALLDVENFGHEPSVNRCPQDASGLFCPIAKLRCACYDGAHD